MVNNSDQPMTQSNPTLEPTQEGGRAFWQREIAGPVVMLNLLRFRSVADYSATPHLAPEGPISGAAAFDRYIAHTLPYLLEGGGELLFLGEGGRFLIGPAEERWDRAMLVRQSSVQSFMAFADHTGYRAGLGHGRQRSRIPGCCPSGNWTSIARTDWPPHRTPTSHGTSSMRNCARVKDGSV
jgi:hypothetical protein